MNAAPTFPPRPRRLSSLRVSLTRPKEICTWDSCSPCVILRVSRSKLQIRFCTPNCLALVLPTRVMQIRRLYEITWNTASDTFTTTSRYAFSHPCIGYSTYGSKIRGGRMWRARNRKREREREKKRERTIENSMKLRRMRAYRIQLIHLPTWDFKIESNIGIVFSRKNCWTNEGCGKNLYGPAINELPRRGSRKNTRPKSRTRMEENE